MIRKGHLAGIASAFRHGELAWLARAAGRGLRLRWGQRTTPPLFATLAVTYHCNHRCFMCDFPQRADGQPETEELLARVRDLARIGTLAVGITGGEPLVHRGLFDIVAEIRRHRMIAHLNTNGSELALRYAQTLVDSGLHSINLSLDAPDAATHDRLRGAPGAFELLEETARKLRSLRSGSRPRLGIVSVISRDNFDDIASIVEVAEAWGVDTVGFLPHHGLVEEGTTLTPDQEAELEQRLAPLIARLDNSPGYLRAFPRFLAGWSSPTTCSAPRGHIAIDPHGTAYPCVPLMTLERGGVPWDPDAPRPVPGAKEREEVCSRCWWNCHRELDLSLGLLAADGRRGWSPPSS